MLLCAESSAAENHREHCDDTCERPRHTVNLLTDRKSGFCPCMIADSRDRVNRQNSPPGMEEIPTRLSQDVALRRDRHWLLLETDATLRFDILRYTIYLMRSITTLDDNWMGRPRSIATAL